ncbi:MAG TPA: dihydrodipicolinate synthase family protein [Longimicrobiaceae bacterium]|nr:dihydrodipicolinate synthase family protein [Longimicrobiaceae bacterium]
MSLLKGVVSVLPTPFTPGDELDLPSLRRVVDAYIDAGVDGLVALGFTSEVARLTATEKRTILETVMDQANRRVPVVVGTSAAGLKLCIQASLQARDAGAAAVMVSPPAMPKINSREVLSHYRDLASACDLPIVVQDFPPLTGYFMEPWLLAEIAREVPSARIIKLEDAPTPLKAYRIIEAAGDLKVDIFGGLGGGFLLEELLAGATGAMTGFAYPEILVRIVSLYHAGEVAEAAHFFYRTVALMRFEFQAGLGVAIRKELLKRRGIFADVGIRAPGPLPDPSTIAAMDRLLRYLKEEEGIEWISA